MTAVEMEVENGARQAMDTEDVDSSGSSSDASGEEVESGREAMEGSDEENEESHANPAFSKFMQGFWDLASVDVPVRVGAAAMIVRHVSSGGDAGYAVKRLVRGMCSSRESARQGFASCLAQVLSVLPEDEPATAAVLEQILKATQTTSAMKGADERELVLGRLLGVSSLALSGRLGSDPESAEGALKAVCELYTKRKWLGQATGEAALLVTSKAFQGEGEFARTALPLLVPLLKGKDGSNLQVPDLTPDQLLLSLGLRSVMRERGLDPQEDVALKQALPSFLRHASVVRVGKAQDLVPALKQSALAFPKVHSVWGRLWDDIGLSPAGQPRAALSTKRLKKLGEVWSAVVDGGLTNASLNSKGTAVLLLKQVLARVPAAGVCHVLSPGIVRLLLNHTKGEENYLFSLVRMTLEQLPKAVSDDEEVQAQVAASLLQRGTIRFDSLAGVAVVSSLVKGMGQEALNAHVEFLKGVVQGQAGWADRQDYSSNGMSIKKETNEAAAASEETPPAETPDETVQGSIAERAQAVEALYSLARSGGGGGGGGSSGKKKGGDGRSAALAALKAGGTQAQGHQQLKSTAVFFLEAGFFAPADGAAPLPEKLSELCRSKFFSAVADIAAKPLFWQASASDADTSSGSSSSSKKKSSKSCSSASSSGEGPPAGALEALWGLHEAWQGLETGGRKFVKGVAVGLDEREACSVALGVVGRIRAGTASGDKLGSAFAGILLMVSLHLLEGSKGDSRGGERCQHIFDLVETYGRISGTGTGDDDDDEEEEEEDEDGTDPDPLSMLADVLVAVVAEPSTHSVRGLRDTARRVWGMVCGARPLTKSALETLLEAVCGEEDGNVPEGGDDSSSEEEEEEEDDGGDDDGDASVKSEESSDDEEEEEVKLDPSDLEELLRGNDGSDDEGVQHHAGADAALGALLGLKKSGRKKGTLEAQRQGYQIRLRALDLLEVVCSRRQDSRYLLGALLPVLNAIKKLEGSARVGTRSGGEASALSKRLQALFTLRLCKCKPRLDDEAAKAGDGAEDFPSQTAEAFSQLMGLCQTWEKDAPLASLALEGALCCLRSLKGRPSSDKDKGGGGKGVEALDGALKALAAAVGDYFGKKRGGGLTASQVGEVMRRFPDVLVPVLVDAAAGAAASDFLRTEAFRLLSGSLQRRASMEPSSRKALLAHCPAIFKALGDVLSTTAAGAATAAAAAAAAAKATASAKEAGATAEAKAGGAGAGAPNSEAKPTDAATKKNQQKKANNTPSSSLTMLKAKRLKPLLGCLTHTIQADEGVGSLAGLTSEAQALRTALEAVGEASASLPMQLLCGEVAQGLDVFGAVEEEEGQKKKKKAKDKSSPKAKRKAAAAAVDDDPVAADSPATAGRGEGGGGDAEQVAPKSSSKKKKRRRESKDDQEG